MRGYWLTLSPLRLVTEWMLHHETYILESVPEVAAKLKEPNTKPRKFEDVVKDVEQATVLVLVY